MKLGITGSRLGMTSKQVISFKSWLNQLQPTEFHHGDCLGVDADAHRIVRERFPLCRIVVHPPESNTYRADMTGDYEMIPRPYRARNQSIVNVCDLLLAFPNGSEQKNPRSGTWMTVRMARLAGKLLSTVHASQNGDKLIPLC